MAGHEPTFLRALNVQDVNGTIPSQAEPSRCSPLQGERGSQQLADMNLSSPTAEAAPERSDSEGAMNPREACDAECRAAAGAAAKDTEVQAAAAAAAPVLREHPANEGSRL